MALPVIGALLARVVGGRLLGSAAARLGSNSVFRGLGTVGGNMAANPVLYPLQKVKDAARHSGGAILRTFAKSGVTGPPSTGEAATKLSRFKFNVADIANRVFAKPATPPGSKAPNLTQQIKNYFRGGFQGGTTAGDSQQPPVQPDGLRSGGDKDDKQPVSQGPVLEAMDRQRRQDAEDREEEDASKGEEIGRKVGHAIASFFTGGIFSLGSKVYEMADQQLESNRYLARFNGQIGAAFAKSDAEAIERNVKTGKAVAGTTELLAENVDAMKETWRPAQDSMQNAANILAAYGAWMVTKSHGPITAALRTWYVTGTAMKGWEWLEGKFQGHGIMPAWQEGFIEMSKQSAIENGRLKHKPPPNTKGKP